MRYDKISKFIVYLSLWLLPCACVSNDREPGEKQIDPTEIYSNYDINGDEESGGTTIKLQFHAGGPDEKAVRLNAPAELLLDEQPIRADSSRMNGIYYEYSGANEEFAGEHEIVFKDKGKSYKEPFTLPVFTLVTHLDSVINRRDIELELKGVRDQSLVRISLTDTSYMGNGIERYDTIVGGKMTITKEELFRLKDGPIQLEISVNENRPMKQGGAFTIFYGLRREFFLQ